MPHDHRLAMPQVTTVDDQFGTHTMEPAAGAVALRKAQGVQVEVTRAQPAVPIRLSRQGNSAPSLSVGMRSGNRQRGRVR